MNISLYEHNENAYRKAVDMLKDKGRAAVIHPTGTGKSFIGFKLCADNEDKKVCWLSPSEYIFKTQLENLKEVTDGYVPDNIFFCTYAKLSTMTPLDMNEIDPDYIILDEFHRCGAEVWGLSVYKLLAIYENVPILGLSATAIRYLDNQRNMADELFDGNIASEMTLGEAIVRGILNPPKYILTVYSYRNSLIKYEKKVSGLNNGVQKDKAEEYLEALKRTLDMADGLDVIFDKHMKDRDGKYIIFCANYEAMEDAIDKAEEWFCKVDIHPHIYSVYSEDPMASSSFDHFKKDNEPGHLKLLYCIDILNEGVHVDDVSGVVLLRPTVSPIIYKQQIGRALSTSKAKEPVIFDIVNNVESLHNIDVIRDEMFEASRYMHLYYGDYCIVNETFSVIDEVRNCIELFDKLEDVITSPWDTMFLEAKKFYEENGNLNVSRKYVTESGLPLGRWIGTQRFNRRKGEESLTEERIEKLDNIGMIWDYADGISWKRGFEACRFYYEQHGNLEVPATYVTDDGFRLGNWYRTQKNKYEDGRLEEAYIEALEKVGMKWGSYFNNKWMDNYNKAKSYYHKNGNSNISSDYITDDGTRLGVWIMTQRNSYAKGRLNDEQIRLLDKIGMSWNRFESKWDYVYQKVYEYYNEHGNINNIPADYRPDGIKISVWLRAQRNNYTKQKLTQERIDKLENIGMIWKPQDALWETGYIHAVEYVKEHGDIDVPKGYISADGYKLKNWLVNQGTRYKKGRMSKDQQLRLEKLGMIFVDKN